MRLHEDGYILITTLIVLFVLTLLIFASAEFGITNQKMQNNWQQYDAVFEGAQWGLQQIVLHAKGEALVLPDSEISVQTTYTLIDTDACGNQTVDLESTAKNDWSTVVLNSRDIFARVPLQKACDPIPVHQVVWWHEN